MDGKDRCDALLDRIDGFFDWNAERSGAQEPEEASPAQRYVLLGGAHRL